MEVPSVGVDVEEIESLVITAADADVALAQRLGAFGKIVVRFQDMAYGCAYSLLGDFHLAEDAAQEAFLVAYQRLGQLREPRAFAGWFRRIVISQCRRITRSKSLPLTGLDVAVTVPSSVPGPPQNLERRETKDKVLAAIAALPEHQRMATTLFYINGYSQKDVAEFLEVPLTTVKKRLHDSRSQLKKRMIAMVEETLHENAPDERFSKRVIEKLLAQPRLLEIEGHPVLEVWKTIQTALPNFNVIKGKEVVDESAIANPWCRQFAFHLDSGNVLRTETTTTTLAAMVGRTPPVRLLTAGRVFHSGRPEIPTKVSHGTDVLCIASDANLSTMKATLQTIFEAVFGPVELKYEKATFHWFDPCMTVSVEYRGKSVGAGCGMMTAKTLKDAGYDPKTVGGFAIRIRLEPWVLLKHGIVDARKLWQPPYVPE